VRFRGGILLAGALALAGGAVACGGSSVCGNGVAESGEQCDDGNQRDDDACSNACLQQPTHDAQIIWTMLAHEAEGFSENCSGVAASTVHLVVEGPLPSTRDIECNYSQYMVNALAPGEYTVTGTLLDGAGNPITNGQTRTTFSIAGAPTGTPVQVRLDFPFADFTRTDYTGDWFYTVTWGGVANKCSAATPPVVKTRVRLERDGQVIKSKEGTPVDGSTPVACYEGDAAHAPAINHLPWGPADVVITGLDATDTPQFEASFETFVGAGISNPTMIFDVNSLTPDAGPPDAGVPDAAPAADGS
jgi:cysteine-rich repeat protein